MAPSDPVTEPERLPTPELDERVSMLCIRRFVRASTSASGSFVAGRCPPIRLVVVTTEDVRKDGDRVLPVSLFSGTGVPGFESPETLDPRDPPKCTTGMKMGCPLVPLGLGELTLEIPREPEPGLYL